MTSVRDRTLALLSIAVTTLTAPGAAQDPCPSASAEDAVAGWDAYAADDMGEARRRFEAAVGRCANDQYARTGLGYVELREGDTAEAERRFGVVVTAEPYNIDALVGLGLAAWRRADLDAVHAYFTRVTALDPLHPTALEYLERVEGRVLGDAPRRDAFARPTGGGPDERFDEAGDAWTAGDTDLAYELYAERLSRNPSDAVALHRMALMTAWQGDYALAIERFDRLLALEPTNTDARVDRARVQAWSGDTDRAIDALTGVLAEEPQHPGALEARALFQAWAGRFQESLSGYEELLAIAPHDGDVRRRQARVLGWASEFEGSESVYRALLERDPGDVDARIGLATTLAFSGRLDDALEQYDVLLRSDRGNRRALRGRGRVLGWANRLVEAEELLRAATAAAPDDAATLAVLGQVLYWQGRPAAAKEVLDEATRLSPTNGDAREQLRAVELELRPATRPTTVYESDSDGNRMWTTSGTVDVHPVPRLGLRFEGYRRQMEQGPLERTALGGTVRAELELDPGWIVSATVGGTRTDGTGDPTFAVVRGGVRTPARRSLGFRVDVARGGLDETAALAERGVGFTDVSGSARWTSGGGLRVDATVGRFLFDGSESNVRNSAVLSVSQRLGRTLTLGTRVRAFSYEKDLQDGYFDPDFYGIGELTSAVRLPAGPFAVLLEAAPGVQQITSDGDPAFSFRGSGQIAYRIAPSRDLALSYAYSSAGLLSLADGASDRGYEYRSLRLGVAWVF